MPSPTNSPNHNLISVIIPTYNRSSLVGGAIQSVLDQTYPDVEIIVVDDGSTDNTATVLANIPSIHVLHQNNKGQGAARQLGLDHCNGAYIATLDSDDFWQPNFLSESLKTLRHAKTTFVFSGWITQTPDGNLISENSLTSLDYLQIEPSQEINDWKILSAESTRRVFTRHSPAPSSSFLVDRRSIPKGWHHNFNISDDWAFLLEIILSNQQATCAYFPSNLWTKQIDGNNICDGHADPIQLAGKHIGDYEKLIDLFDDKLDAEELKFLRNQLVLHFRDLVYFQSITKGARRPAINNAIKCLFLKPSLTDCKILGKCLVRSFFGLRP